MIFHLSSERLMEEKFSKRHCKNINNFVTNNRKSKNNLIFANY